MSEQETRCTRCDGEITEEARLKLAALHEETPLCLECVNIVIEMRTAAQGKGFRVGI